MTNASKKKKGPLFHHVKDLDGLEEEDWTSNCLSMFSWWKLFFYIEKKTIFDKFLSMIRVGPKSEITDTGMCTAFGEFALSYCVFYFLFFIFFWQMISFSFIPNLIVFFESNWWGCSLKSCLHKLCSPRILLNLINLLLESFDWIFNL